MFPSQKNSFVQLTHTKNLNKNSFYWFHKIKTQQKLTKSIFKFKKKLESFNLFFLQIFRLFD